MTGRADAPGPMLRRGPRPLLLHLSLAAIASRFSNDGSPNSKPDSPTWSAVETAVHAALRDEAAGAPPAVDAALVAGIAAYRRHPWVRTLEDPPSVWAEGGSRLLDYGAPDAAGPVVLVVPSLINRAYVLDLMPERSMLRYLAGQGVRPLLLDWGWPGAVERGFTLTDYIAGRLERAMAAAAARAGGPVILAGYCMGGNLAVAAAERRPDLVSALALLATPWDFHVPDRQRAQQAALCLPLLESSMGLTGTLPIDALQTLFAMLDPFGVGEKYRRFASLPPDGPRTLLFVALEDWLNDGVPLVAGVARDCLSRWYGENAPARGMWHVAGQAVDPGRLRMPCFIAIPGRDRIVPPASARALARAIAGATVHEPAAGHVGMVAGADAARALWEPLSAWMGGAGRR
jgi:polyhydroxyalkanoate synthase subunit PhaC